MFCPNCGSRVNDSASFCPNCGNSVKSAAASQTATTGVQSDDPFDTPPASQQQAQQQAQNNQAQQQQQAPAQQQQQQPAQQQNVNTENTMAIIGFVLSLMGFGPISLVLSILGYQNAKKGAKYKNLAIAGIVISAIATFVWAISFLSTLSTCGFAFCEGFLDGLLEDEYLIMSLI